MSFVNLLKRLKKKSIHHEPLVKVFISRERLLNNLNEYRNKSPDLLFAPVLKSNAYGHGIVDVGKILNEENIAFFALDSLYEAITLRNNSIKTKILIIGYSQLENIKKNKLENISFTITSLEQLQEIDKSISSKIKIHLKVDTGMHRQGILNNQTSEAIRIIKLNKFLVLEGICSHFADADNIDDSFTKSQITKWNDTVATFKKEFNTIKFIHMSATSGNFYNKDIVGNVVRLGIGLYGINSSPLQKLNLKPVMQIKSIISSIKHLHSGEFIGYNNTHELKQDSIIATVPLGYFEGVDRRLSNTGFFKVNHHNCQIVGRVSMNITSIDVTSVPNIKLNDEVIIISDNPDDKNSVENIAEITNTIPWEILIHIPQHLRRITA